MSKNKKVDNNCQCMFTDMCKNFDNDYAKNEYKSYPDFLYCKNCDPYEDSGRIECKNMDLIKITKFKKDEIIKNVSSEITKDVYSKNERYNIVNNPAHYTKDRLFEPAWVINDWGLSYDLGTCVKYIGRLGRKDDKSQDIRKAFWYLVHEIALHNKDISKEELIGTIEFIYNKEKLLQDKTIKSKEGDSAVVHDKEDVYHDEIIDYLNKGEI